MGLAGKTVLIFGGSAGIGAATAKLLARDGANVVALGRNRQRLEKLQSDEPRIQTMECDILRDEDVDTVIARIERIDHVVVTSGTIAKGKLADFDSASSMFAFDERVGAICRIVKATLPRMKEGSFAFTSGTAAVRPTPCAGMMGAALAAVEHITRTLALEIAPLRANAIRPGLIMTDLVKSYGGDQWEQIAQGIAATLPGKKPGLPEQAADAIRFLLLSKFVNGEILTIDGGGRWV